MLSTWRERCQAVIESFTFDYDGVPADSQFVRHVLYRDIKRRVEAIGLSNRDVLEIGSSNGVIASYLSPRTLKVTGDYPAVDVSFMPEYADASYDVVILDQVLEHVKQPEAGVAEVRRVLRPGGYAIISLPFLIKIHGRPNDYSRFTEDGLRHLLREFRDVEVGQWGNRFTLNVTMRHGWLSTWQTRRRLLVFQQNEPEWPIVLWAVCRK